MNASSLLVLADRDVRRVGVLHADDMIAGIDVMDLAGHPARHVGEEINAGLADVFQRHIAPQRGVEFVPAQDIAEVADAGGGQRLDRTRRQRVDADVVLARSAAR